MRDRSLGILLMVLFGLSGITILLLAWLWPMSAADRVLTALFGSIGLMVAVTRASVLRSPPAGVSAERVMVEIDIENKP